MTSIFKRSFVLTVLMTWAISSVALAVPEQFSNMSAKQLNAYLNVQMALSTQKSKSKIPPFAVNDLISWGKEDLRNGNPTRALVFFDFALILAPQNQVAAFYASIALLSTNPEIIAQLQQMGLMNSQDEIIFNKHKTILPDVIYLQPTQALTANFNSNELRQAIAQLSRINQTFSDTVSDPKLGEVTLDYAAVKGILMGLNVISYQLHLTNAYNTGSTQISKNDLGELTPDNLKSVTTNVNALYAELNQYGYISKDGHINNSDTSLLSYLQPYAFVYHDNSLGNNNYVVYSWLGAWGHRVALGPKDYCGQQTVYRYNGTVLSTYNPVLDPTTGFCKSLVITSPNGPIIGGTDFNAINLSIIHNGQTYNAPYLQYLPYYNSLNQITTYYPIDPVLSDPNSAAILSILTNISHDRVTVPSLLSFYRDLLTKKANTASELSAAKESLLGMVDSYLDLDSFVLAQDEKLGVNYVIQAYTPVKTPKHPLTAQAYQKDKAAHQAQQQAVHNLMVAIENNLTNSVKYPYVQPNDPAFGDTNLLASFKINFASIFNPARDTRGLTQAFDQAMSKYHMIPVNFSDPSFAGILPGATDAEVNFLLKEGAQIKSATITTANGIKSIVIGWNGLNQIKNGQNIIGFDLYRSSTPTVNNHSTLVAHLDANSTSYTDSQINLTTPTYYYRLYTHYRFTDNNTANSFSKVFKVKLISTTPFNPPVIFQTSDQTMNAGDTLTLFVQGVDLNQDSIIWNENTQTQISNYGASWGTCNGGSVPNCPNGGIYIQLSPSADSPRGTFNIKVYASDSHSGPSIMSFIVNVQPLPRGVVYGQVIDSKTKKILDNVIVIASGDGLSTSAKSDRNGEYTLNPMPIGQYKVSASLSGYNTYSVNVDLTRTNLDQRDNFSLVKK